MAEYIIQGETLVSLADEIRVLSDIAEKISLDTMVSKVNNANTEIESQEILISQIAAALAGKAGGSGIELPSLTNPANESEVFKDSEYINQLGNKKVGTFTLEEEITAQDNLIAQIQSALSGKVSGENSGKPEQSKTISITENGDYEILPDEGYTLSGVTVNVEIVEEDDFATNFQKVEYITSTSETYIITDFIADNDCGVEMVASFPNFADHACMGSRIDSGNTRFYAAYPLSATSAYFGFNTATKVTTSSLTVNTVYRFQTNFLNSRLANVYDEDGNQKGSTSISATLTAHSEPIYIFAYNNIATGGAATSRVLSLYSARCSRKNEVVREYIPCYRKSDGIIGLYEKFTKQFLTNANDAGSFSKGPDITE